MFSNTYKLIQNQRLGNSNNSPDKKPAYLLMDGGVLMGGRTLPMPEEGSSEKKEKKKGESDQDYLGGKIYIKDSNQNYLFFRTVAADIRANNDLFLVENVTFPVFRFFLDLDFKGCSPVSHDTIWRIAKCCQEEAAAFFPRKEDWSPCQFSVAICGIDPSPIHSKTVVRDSYTTHTLSLQRESTVPESDIESSRKKGVEPIDYAAIIQGLELGCPDMLPKTQRQKFKSAAHFIFPFLFVDQERALYIRQAVVSRLEKELGPRSLENEENSWEDVVDEQVFCGNSSLRMVGSSKVEKCKACGSVGWVKDRTHPLHAWTECLDCKCTGKINIGRVYTLQNFLTNSGKTDEGMMLKIKRDMAKTLPEGNLLNMTSIRCYDKPLTPGFKLYKGVMHFTHPLTCKTYEDARAKTHLARVNGSADAQKFVSSLSKGKRGEKIIFVAQNSEEREAVGKLLQMIRTDFTKDRKDDKIYVDLMIKKIVLFPILKKAFIEVKGKGCHFCLNSNANHSSAEIFFELDMSHQRQNLVLKCYSSKPEIKSSGKMCKEFSKVKIVDGDVVAPFLKKIGIAEMFTDMSDKLQKTQSAPQSLVRTESQSSTTPSFQNLQTKFSAMKTQTYSSSLQESINIISRKRSFEMIENDNDEEVVAFQIPQKK
jgi:hypothetical protein